MATVPTVKTWATGDRFSSSAMNNGVRTPLQFLLNGAPFVALTQSVATAAWAAGVFADITFDTETADTDSQHSPSTNPERVVIGTTPGYYLVFGTVAFANDTTGTTRRARITKNGVGVDGSQFILPPATLTSVPTVAQVVQAISSTDYITLQGYHDASSSIGTAVSATYRSSLTAYFIRSL
jgi:hypothetical protein